VIPVIHGERQLNALPAARGTVDSAEPHYVGTFLALVRAQASAFAITPQSGVPTFAATSWQLRLWKRAARSVAV
jgi:hypothetical protein